jgi:endonuclease/exonuclease/phosphatase (EEP) superfamily protein YafD
VSNKVRNTISAIFLLCLLTSLSGCYHITRSIKPDLECEQGALFPGEENQFVTIINKNQQLQPQKLKVFIWNSYKGKMEGWLDDFFDLSDEHDIVLLQEAYLDDDLLTFLENSDWSWNTATTFRYRKIETGVLTASWVIPDLHCSFQIVEPWIRTPKAVLISRYGLSGTDEKLVVANVHLINFTLNLKAYKDQLDRLKSVLEHHDGPLIIAGDFNTWSEKRSRLVLELMDELHLQPVTFKKDERSMVLGNRVDHVFYRELAVSAAEGIDTKTSDHNPMSVEFTFETAPHQYK